MTRSQGRGPKELRPVRFHRGFTGSAPGSVLVEAGRTRVLCTVSAEEGVPPWLEGSGMGWVTAEYGMLPAATSQRRPRQRQNGRSAEIQRLIGRCLRAVVDRSAIGPRTLIADCDVIEADGGTRTASVTGAFVALVDALSTMRRQGLISVLPVREPVAAVSVGVVDGELLLDLDYAEDSRASVDLNVAMTESGRLVEVQGSAEGAPFSRELLDRLLSLAGEGIGELVRRQREALRDALGR